jgi:predicted nucleic-acid-binding Zn-ribbon protein
MDEVKKCPKCGGLMEIRHLDGAYNWNPTTNYLQWKKGPHIWGYACQDWGYVEFYIETAGVKP